MASINQVSRIQTHEGGRAQHINPKQQLERSVMACMLWEDNFYEDGVSIADRIRTLAEKVEIRDLTDIIRRAKNDMKLRHAPLLLVRELARRKHGRPFVRQILNEVITRPDDLTELVALYFQDGRAPLAKQVKLGLADAIRKFDAYQLAKYDRKGKAVRLRDVLRLCHAKPANAEQAALWKQLNEDALPAPDTWESAMAGGKGKKETFTALLKENKLGGLALLRNLRNMQESGVDRDLILSGIANLKTGRLLPMNFIAAAATNPGLEPDIEGKFLECFAEKEKVSGRTIILVDVSGSMDSKLSNRSVLSRMDAACGLAMIAREVFTDAGIYTFSHQLVEVPARRGFALRDAILHSQMHGGTYLGQAVRALQQQRQFDRLIVITDEQSHDSVPQVKNGVMVNVSTDKNGVGYGAWRHIDGWSDKVVDYIIAAEAT